MLPFCNVLPSSGTTLHVLLYCNTVILYITLTLSLNLPNFLGFIHFKVVDYVQKKFEELGSPNKMKVSMGHGAKAWVSDFNHPHYMAGRKAMKTGTVAEWCKTNRGFFFSCILITGLCLKEKRRGVVFINNLLHSFIYLCYLNWSQSLVSTCLMFHPCCAVP